MSPNLSVQIFPYLALLKRSQASRSMSNFKFKSLSKINKVQVKMPFLELVTSVTRFSMHAHRHYTAKLRTLPVTYSYPLCGSAFTDTTTDNLSDMCPTFVCLVPLITYTHAYKGCCIFPSGFHKLQGCIFPNWLSQVVMTVETTFYPQTRKLHGWHL